MRLPPSRSLMVVLSYRFSSALRIVARKSKVPTSSKYRTILIYGLDPVLLDTRRMILEHAGFEVEIAHNCQDLQLRTASIDYNLLIVCHTVSRTEQQQIASIKNSQRPHVLQMPILLLPDAFLKQVQQQLR